MSGRKVVIRRLRELDEAYAARILSGEADARLRKTLEQRAVQAPIRARLRWWPVFAFAAGAAVMAVGLLSRKPDPSPALPQVSTAEAQPASICGHLKDEVRGLSVGECREGGGVRVDALAASVLRRTGTSFEVAEGKVLFDVEPRGIDRVHVYAGPMVIEVKGTRFIVEHDATGGAVALLEGRVEVTVGASPPREIMAGERVEWVHPTTAEAADPPADAHPETTTNKAWDDTSPRKTRPQPRARSSSEVDLESLLQEVNRLRRAREFKRAIELLEAADTGGWNARERRVVSYEIGTLLERQLRDFQAACAHWDKHRVAFRGSRYQTLVERSVERMKCEAGREK